MLELRIEANAEKSRAKKQQEQLFDEKRSI